MAVSNSQEVMSQKYSVPAEVPVITKPPYTCTGMKKTVYIIGKGELV